MTSAVDFVIDTDVVIGLLKAHPPATALAEQVGLDLGRSVISQITRMELLSFGDLDAQEEAAIREFVAACRVHGLDEAVEDAAIRIRRARACKLPDAIVLATARVCGARLVTLDQRLHQLAEEADA